MTLERLLEKYGQPVSVHYGGETAGVEARAFVQPIQERGESWTDRLPTPLGAVEKRRLTYLGSPEVSLEKLEDGYVEYQGKRYDVKSAQAVCVGEICSHWWALLTPRDEEEKP